MWFSNYIPPPDPCQAPGESQHFFAKPASIAKHQKNGQQSMSGKISEC